MRRALRAGAAAGAVAVAVVLSASPAAAAAPGPALPYVQSAKCIAQLAPPSPVRNAVSWGQKALQYTSAWQFSRGAGVKIAIIDTGVNPGPAFRGRLTGLADLVVARRSSAGLDDCDGHGTLVAGIAAASPDEQSGFSGVAPDATVLSIRQSSENYQTRNQSQGGSAPSGEAQGAGTRESLATAIDYAVARGAKVINISEADCQSAGNADLPVLTAAVQSAVAHDVVVVAAAGNLSSGGPCGTQNTPGKAPVTAATPADVNSPGVLAVAAVQSDGSPASFSLAGSWVDIAAPGTQVISTDPYPDASGQVNKITTGNGTGSIQGTSFAAPYVTGVAALVRARYPTLSAVQVVKLLERTAVHPAAAGGRNDYVGYGLVDPVAALTALQPAPTGTQSNPAALRHVTVPSASTKPRRIALSGLAGVGALLVLLVVVAQSRRARRRALRR